MEISFIHMQILIHVHVNKTKFHLKGFTLRLALKQRRKATQKSPIKQSGNKAAFPRFLGKMSMGPGLLHAPHVRPTGWANAPPLGHLFRRLTGQDRYKTIR